MRQKSHVPPLSFSEALFIGFPKSMGQCSRILLPSLPGDICITMRQDTGSVPRRVRLHTGSGRMPLSSCSSVATWFHSPLAYDSFHFLKRPRLNL